MKEYKYLAELSYVCGDIVKEIKQENILTILNNYDFINNNMPMLFITGMFDKNLIDEMLVNADKAMLTLGIYKYVANAESIVKELYFKKNFSYFVDGDINYNKEIDYEMSPENKEKKDILKKFSIGLIDKEIIENDRKTYNATVVDTTMINVVNDATKHMPILIEPFTYNDKIPQLVVPPHESVSKTLAFLNDVKVFYDTPYVYFLDHDCAYLVSCNGKATAKKGEKYSTVLMKIRKKTDVEGMRPGMDDDDDNKCYVIPLSVADTSYTIDKNKQKGFNNLVSILDSGKEKSPEVGSTPLSKAIGDVTKIVGDINKTINSSLDSIKNIPGDISKAVQRTTALVSSIDLNKVLMQNSTSTIKTQVQAIQQSTGEPLLGDSGSDLFTEISQHDASITDSLTNVQGLDTAINGVATPLTQSFDSITGVKSCVNGVTPVNISNNTNALTKQIRTASGNAETITAGIQTVQQKSDHAKNIETQLTNIINKVSSNSTAMANAQISAEVANLKKIRDLLTTKNNLLGTSLTSLLQAPNNLNTVLDQVKPTIDNLNKMSNDLKGKLVNVDNISSSLANVKKNVFSSISNISSGLKGLNMNSLKDIKNDISKFKDLSNIGLLGIPKFDSKLNFSNSDLDKEKNKIIRISNDNPNAVKNVKASMEMNLSQLSINKNDLDTSVFTINKEYIVRNYDAHSDKDGHFVLKKKNEAYVREGDHFNLNLMLYFCVAPNSTASTSSSTAVTPSSNETDSKMTKVNPESTKGVSK